MPAKLIVVVSVALNSYGSVYFFLKFMYPGIKVQKNISHDKSQLPKMQLHLVFDRYFIMSLTLMIFLLANVEKTENAPIVDTAQRIQFTLMV